MSKKDLKQVIIGVDLASAETDECWIKKDGKWKIKVRKE